MRAVSLGELSPSLGGMEARRSKGAVILGSGLALPAEQNSELILPTKQPEQEPSKSTQSKQAIPSKRIV